MRAALAIAAVLSAGAAAAQPMAQQRPAPATAQPTYAAELDAAKAHRLAGRRAQAQAIVAGVLKRDPNHFRANYTQALLSMDAGDVSGGARRMQAAVDRLNGAPAPDPTIYNTLGYALMRQGKLPEAKAQFALGYRHKAQLPPASRVKLLNNYALTASLMGDKATAQAMWAEAGRLGNSKAQKAAVAL